LLALPLFAAASVLPTGGTALAHGHREVDGVEWTVGWAEEPAFVGFRNAVQLILERDGRPVEGAEDGLRVVVSLGDSSTEPLELRAVFGTPGEYRADLVPTSPGDYTFRFTGTLEGRRVDESWTGSKDGFDEVTGTTAISFPRQAPSNADLAERIESVGADARSARDAATLPLVVGAAGVVLGLVALVVSVRRRPAT
jgi:hypothetical protein